MVTMESKELCVVDWVARCVEASSRQFSGSEFDFDLPGEPEIGGIALTMLLIKSDRPNAAKVVKVEG